MNVAEVKGSSLTVRGQDLPFGGLMAFISHPSKPLCCYFTDIKTELKTTTMGLPFSSQIEWNPPTAIYLNHFDSLS